MDIAIDLPIKKLPSVPSLGYTFNFYPFGDCEKFRAEVNLANSNYWDVCGNLYLLSLNENGTSNFWREPIWRTLSIWSSLYSYFMYR